MTTNPPEHTPFSGQESHRLRAVAESFGVDAGRYDRSRPSYPKALVDRIVAGAPGREILDVGIGTGIVARQLRAAGCSVLGVEPDVRMAEFARRDGIPVEVSTFETWDPRGRRFDAVVSGQAWHWVDPVVGAARAGRALRPGGALAVFWNVSRPPDDLNEAFLEVYRRVIPDSPMAQLSASAVGIGAYSIMCDKASDGIRRSGTFDEPQLWTAEWDRAYTRDEWLEFSATTGATTRLPKDVLDRVLSGLGAAIDAAGGSLLCRYTTVAVMATSR
ncbi:class I SAM-dependent methyltransferase [Nocardia transvalensis]|uniref:class I SAM-dependent methyltransferase n=1 Tax=Nocardia transvalensis TaxID=37333 RepID=UPI0018930676|nr:class I SAM-dependent methyltransferase [Nocardia transvalensis]MBF6328337.1 class I SAM-dependent methyltransferase [Nocardia transvalensis]